MISQYLAAFYLENAVHLYVMFGLIAWFLLIQIFKVEYGSTQGIERVMKKMFFWSSLWPYALTTWILTWPLFTWKFWTQEVQFDWIFRNPWEFDK